MQLNEDTYKFMRKASSQIEGITCALSVYIEDTIDVAKEYHYRVYNELMNDIRKRHIDTIIQIKDSFEDTSNSIENIAERMYASAMAKNTLREELQMFDECLQRLIIHSENIRECNSNTENPNIPNADDEIYKTFSRYKSLISEYILENPADDDIVALIIYSFYKAAINIYDNLFYEYDKMMERLSVEVQERRQKIVEHEERKSLGIVEKGTIAEDIGKAALGATVAIIGGIRKKEVFSIVDSAIGLVKTISEELEDVLPKESLARKCLKGIELFGKSMDLIGGLGIQESLDLGNNATSAVKIMGAVVGVNGLHKINEEGKLDSMIAAAETTAAWVSVVGSAVSGNPLKALSKLPRTVDKTMKLVEYIAEYYHEKDVHELPKCIDVKLHNLAEKIKKHQEDVKDYKAKLIRGIPVRKPNAPPKWMRKHEGVSFVSDSIETIQKIIRGDYNDIIAKIL